MMQQNKCETIPAGTKLAARIIQKTMARKGRRRMSDT